MAKGYPDPPPKQMKGSTIGAIALVCIGIAIASAMCVPNGEPLDPRTTPTTTVDLSEETK